MASRYDLCKCGKFKTSQSPRCISCRRAVKPEERFWKYVQKTETCWLWTGNKNKKGYGRFVLKDRKMVTPHRFAYELLVGPIAEGMTIDHTCRVKRCCNPKHLEQVTNLENTRRGVPFRKQVLMTHCKRGHPLSGSNLYIGTGGRRVCRTCHSGYKSYGIVEKVCAP
jgi:hypothetical protein